MSRLWEAIPIPGMDDPGTAGAERRTRSRTRAGGRKRATGRGNTRSKRGGTRRAGVRAAKPQGGTQTAGASASEGGAQEAAAGASASEGGTQEAAAGPSASESGAQGGAGTAGGSEDGAAAAADPSALRTVSIAPEASPGPQPGEVPAGESGLPEPDAGAPSEVTPELVGQFFGLLGAAGYWGTGDAEWLPDDTEQQWLYPSVAEFVNRSPRLQRLFHAALVAGAPALVGLWVWVRVSLYLPEPYGEGRPVTRGAKLRRESEGSLDRTAEPGGTAPEPGAGVPGRHAAESKPKGEGGRSGAATSLEAVFTANP